MNFKHTKPEYKEVSQFSPMFAIDCEMCMTEVQSELTRISVVNEQLEVVCLDLIFRCFVPPVKSGALFSRSYMSL